MGAEIPDGAVLVARAVLNSSLWTMRPEDRIVAITCICMCNWKPSEHFVGGKSITIPKGSFVSTYARISESAHLTNQTVRTALSNLEKVGFLTRKSTNRFTVFCVPKYEHYQDITKYYNTKSNKRLTNDQQTDGRNLTNGHPKYIDEFRRTEEREKADAPASAGLLPSAMGNGKTDQTPAPGTGIPSLDALVRIAKEIKCPDSDEKIRRELEALCARADIGTKRLTRYLLTNRKAHGRHCWEYGPHIEKIKNDRPDYDIPSSR